MLFVIVLFFCGYICKTIYSDGMNPGSVMSFLWSLVLLVYCIDLVQFDHISQITYYLIVCGVMFFSFGSLCCRPFLSPKNPDYSFDGLYINNTLTYSTIINYRVFITFQVITILVYLPEAINSIRLFSRGFDFSFLRANQVSVISNVLILLLRNYLVLPFIILVYPITILCLLSEDESSTLKYSVLFLSIMICFIHIMSMGGRSPLIYFLVYFIIIFKLKGRSLIKNKKYSLILLILAVVFLIAYSKISASRGVHNFFESNIVYFSGCVPLFDSYLKEITSYTNGGAFLYGIFNLIFTLLGNLGIDSPDFFSNITEEIYVESIKSVGADLYMNAFVSWFFYFIKDGGIVALIIESFLYGLLSGFSYVWMKKNPNNPLRTILYSVILFTIVFSFIRYQLIQYYYFLAVMYLPFFFTRGHLNHA